MFLDALRESPKIRGLLVGAGTETLSLPENALALGSRSDVDQLYASADLIISTSLAESFGLTVAEGMSSGCVPIVTDVGSFQMIIADTGRVIESNDKKALVAALADAAALDRSELTTRGMRARARVIERFSLQRMVDNYARLYASES
jgi:glycosyltransferase involved in cell wall biosynthesis